MRGFQHSYHASYIEFDSYAVIANALFKKLCLRMFPEASSFARIIEIRNVVEPVPTGVDSSAPWACLETDHRVYASLSRVLTSSAIENCISDAICASSTDNYPEESIKNTLEPSDRVDHRASYWSSKGENNPSAPETLMYKLASKLCLITEFHVHPFQGCSISCLTMNSPLIMLLPTDCKYCFGTAYFQFGFPIYSAKAVRFQIGHAKAPSRTGSDKRDEFPDFQSFADDKFVWTYTSPEFPMAQVIFFERLLQFDYLNHISLALLPRLLLTMHGVYKEHEPYLIN